MCVIEVYCFIPQCYTLSNTMVSSSIMDIIKRKKAINCFIFQEKNGLIKIQMFLTLLKNMHTKIILKQKIVNF